MAILLAVRANAGEYNPPAPAPEVYGTGWYGAIARVNRRNSLFVEYKFLEYTGQNDWGNTRVLGQHLVGAGWRFHF
jgi:hypothetical protein